MVVVLCVTRRASQEAPGSPSTCPLALRVTTFLHPAPLSGTER